MYLQIGSLSETPTSISSACPRIADLLDTVILGSNIDHTPRGCRKRLRAVLSTFSHKSPCRPWHTYDSPGLFRSYAPPIWCQPT